MSRRLILQIKQINMTVAITLMEQVLAQDQDLYDQF